MIQGICTIKIFVELCEGVVIAICNWGSSKEYSRNLRVSMIVYRRTLLRKMTLEFNIYYSFNKLSNLK